MCIRPCIEDEIKLVLSIYPIVDVTTSGSDESSLMQYGIGFCELRMVRSGSIYITHKSGDKTSP